MSRGLIIAAPSSNSGKTTVTLGLLRALASAGAAPVSVKLGPDYLDPVFHALASRTACYNLDVWAMRATTCAAIVAARERAGSVVIAEGVMGLFDGATPDSGSTADAAAATGWPVVLVVDAGGMSSSIAALVHGFASFRRDVQIAGVIANRIGSPRHRDLIAEALAPIGIGLLGAIPRHDALTLPSRHLGLVQAREHADIETFLDRAGAEVERHVDLRALLAIAAPARLGPPAAADGLAAPPVPGQRIAVADDLACAFAYPWTLREWQRAGAEVIPFSPLADEGPAPDADAVFLPGGYPELHAGVLAGNTGFKRGMHGAAGRGAFIYGECGGFMLLGEALVDAQGEHHPMLGLLPVTTSFAERRLHLGYRALETLRDSPLGDTGVRLKGHEFHFASIAASGLAEPLFGARDARGLELPDIGQIRGRVAGSFAHLIDSA
ncbi:MAG: cobyrinate a,c-diamide synthase [Pseudomonadota bacterium]